MAQIAEIAGAGAGLLSLPQRIILADGWTRRAIAFVAGASGALALAPFNIVPAMFAPLTVAVWLIDGAADASPRFPLPRFSRRLEPAGGWVRLFLAGLWWMKRDARQKPTNSPGRYPRRVRLPAVSRFFRRGFRVARLVVAWRRPRLRACRGTGAAGGCVAIFRRLSWNDFGMALTSAAA
jgi:apolipoprotein N-acyltransferase